MLEGSKLVGENWKEEKKLNMFYREILDVLAMVHEIRSTKRRQKNFSYAVITARMAILSHKESFCKSYIVHYVITIAQPTF